MRGPDDILIIKQGPPPTERLHNAHQRDGCEERSTQGHYSTVRLLHRCSTFSKSKTNTHLSRDAHINKEKCTPSRYFYKMKYKATITDIRKIWHMPLQPPLLKTFTGATFGHFKQHWAFVLSYKISSQKTSEQLRFVNCATLLCYTLQFATTLSLFVMFHTSVRHSSAPGTEPCGFWTQ